jgi:predicted nucleic acid-binding protein
MSEAIFVDANIIMYAVGAEHPYRQSCQASLTKIADEQVYALVSSEIHQEILHRYLSLGLPDKARQISIKLETLIPVTLPVTLADIHQSRKLIKHYAKLKSRDLIHVAVMLNHGISRILMNQQQHKTSRFVAIAAIAWLFQFGIQSFGTMAVNGDELHRKPHKTGKALRSSRIAAIEIAIREKPKRLYSSKKPSIKPRGRRAGRSQLLSRITCCPVSDAS